MHQLKPEDLGNGLKKSTRNTFPIWKYKPLKSKSMKTIPKHKQIKSQQLWNYAELDSEEEKYQEKEKFHNW